MSEDKNNKEQSAATQTVAKALDDAIGDDGPVEHETTVFARDQDEGHLGKRPLTPTPPKTGKHATKRDFGSFHGSSSNWPPSPKLAPAGQAPTREDANARKKGKSALDAPPGVETPRKHDAPSKQSDREGSPPPAPKEAEVEVDGRASSDNEGARKDDAIDPIVDPAGEDTDVEDSHELAHQHWRSPDDPFLRDQMVFAKVGRTWYAGSISARHPSRGGRFVYDVHTYAERMLENVPKSRLLLFTKEEFERMFALMKNWRRAEAARLCLFYAAREFNCNCARPEDRIDLKRPGLRKELRQELNVPDELINRVRSTDWYKDLMKRRKQFKRRESAEGTRP